MKEIKDFVRMIESNSFYRPISIECIKRSPEYEALQTLILEAKKKEMKESNCDSCRDYKERPGRIGEYLHRCEKCGDFYWKAREETFTIRIL